MRLTDNVHKQDIGQSLHALLRERCGALPERLPGTRHRFTHIINPYRCPPGSVGDRTQRLTFAALAQARQLAAGRHRVDTVAVGFPDDRDFAAAFFDRHATIGRTVLDGRRFQVPRPLPLLFDLLEAGVGGPGDDGDDGGHIIFTNTDICPAPGFYDAIAALLDLGFDALTINRRTVASYPPDASWLPLAAAEPGRPHEGFDCFVFPRAAFPHYRRSDACIAAGGVMRSLLYNMVAFSRNMLMLTDAHLTCHIGDDKEWDRPELRDYVTHNWAEARRVFDHLAPEHGRRLQAFCDTHGEWDLLPRHGAPADGGGNHAD
ncbi:hypothetical protein [Azospirillum sp.]|uniref:hypothetical protein n=1 Tax=Azospirillum sp. TaxID=34012 RepID=UPI002D43B27A|nr:hypothetical protein [Azospirillum sp.]HYD64523.1 hypothetical protein [Azospirillum sp.]